LYDFAEKSLFNVYLLIIISVMAVQSSSYQFLNLRSLDQESCVHETKGILLKSNRMYIKLKVYC